MSATSDISEPTPLPAPNSTRVRGVKVSLTKITSQVRVGIDPTQPWAEVWVDVEVRRTSDDAKAALEPLLAFLARQADLAMGRCRP